MSTQSSSISRLMDVYIHNILRNIYINVLCYKCILQMLIYNRKCIKNVLRFTLLTFPYVYGRSSHQRCSVKKTFWKISQNSQENTCARASFLIKLQATILWKERLWHRCFPVSFSEIFQNVFFTEHLRATAFHKILSMYSWILVGYISWNQTGGKNEQLT